MYDCDRRHNYETPRRLEDLVLDVCNLVASPWVDVQCSLSYPFSVKGNLAMLMSIYKLYITYPSN